MIKIALKLSFILGGVWFLFIQCSPPSDSIEEGQVSINQPAPNAGTSPSPGTTTNPSPGTNPAPGANLPDPGTNSPPPSDSNTLTMSDSDVTLPVLITDFTDAYAQVKITVNKPVDVTLTYKVKKSDGNYMNQGAATAVPINNTATFNIPVMPAANNYPDDTYTVEFTANNKLAPPKTISKNIQINIGCKTNKDTVFTLKISAKRIGMQGSIFGGFNLNITNSAGDTLSTLNNVFYNKRGSTPDSGYVFTDETLASLQHLSDSENLLSANKISSYNFTLTKVTLAWICRNGTTSTSATIYENTSDAPIPTQFLFSRP